MKAMKVCRGKVGKRGVGGRIKRKRRKGGLKERHAGLAALGSRVLENPGDNSAKEGNGYITLQRS